MPICKYCIHNQVCKYTERVAELEKEIKNQYYITSTQVIPLRIECKHRRKENDCCSAN